MKTVIVRTEGDGPELHYIFGEDGKDPERGMLRDGGEHRNFVITGNALLTIGTPDTVAQVETPAALDNDDDDAEDPDKPEGDGTFEDADPQRPQA